jgi:hypothetical protein
MSIGLEETNPLLLITEVNYFQVCSSFMAVYEATKTLYLLYSYVTHPEVVMGDCRLPPRCAEGSTFSETCIVIHICENDQQDAHFFSLIYPN